MASRSVNGIISDALVNMYILSPTPTGLYACFGWMLVKGVQSVRPTHQGYHQEEGIGAGGQRDPQYEYVPGSRMLAIGLQKASKTREIVEQGQTRLKLNLRVSTLYIQVEECLSVSWYHHSAMVVAWDVGGVVPS